MTNDKPLAQKKEFCLAALVYFVVFAIILSLNLRCGYITDDFHFRFVWLDFMPSEADRPVSSLGDIFESMANYYNMSGGRVLAHFVVYLLVNMNCKVIFDVINSAMFIVLGLLIYRAAFGQERIKALPQAMIYASMFMLLPFFGDNVLWLSGSVNYLWAGTLLLATILYFGRHYRDKNILKKLLLLVMVLISSSTNETTGGMLFLWIAAFLITEKQKPNLTAVFCLALCAVGAANVVLAPGNAARADEIGSISLFDIKEAFVVFQQYTVWLFENYRIPLVIASAGLILLVRFGQKDRAIKMLPWMISSAAGLYALVMTGFQTNRPTFFPILIMLAGIWKILHHVTEMYRGGAFGDMSEGNKIFCFSLICGEIVFWCTGRLSNAVFGSALVELIAAVIGISAGYGLYKLLSKDENRSAFFEYCNKLNGRALKKTGKWAAVCAAAVCCGLIAFNYVQYFVAMDRADKIIVQRYNEYINGDELERFENKSEGWFFSYQYHISLGVNEYNLQWIERCVDFEIDDPELRMFL
ncbi:MAG: DUF6056 family protein [Oscillospiraceae bacterium]